SGKLTVTSCTLVDPDQVPVPSGWLRLRVSLPISSHEEELDLDTSKESSHTADHEGFWVVDAQTSGFCGGGRERLSGREPPSRSSMLLRLATHQLFQGGIARVRQASALKTDSTSHLRQPLTSTGHFSQHALGFRVDELHDDQDADIHSLCSC